jgi:F-type H+-transporting ATPase subunit b
MSLSMMSKRTTFAALAALALLAGRARADSPPDEPNARAAAAESEADKEALHPSDPTREWNWTNLDYKGKDQEGGPLGDHKIGDHAPEAGQEEEPMPAPFLYLVGNFLLLIAILVWKAVPKARQTAEKRHDDIQKALDEAARLRTQAKGKLDEYQSKLAAAEKEITAMVDGMRADAEADKKRIIAAAEAQAAALKKDADERIAAEILRARTALAREVASAAVAAAEQLIRDKATAADQSRLVDTFIGDVAKTKPLTKEQV